MSTRIPLSSRARVSDVLPWWLRLPTRLGVAAYRHPRTTGTITCLSAVGCSGGRWALVGVVLAPAVGLAVWRIVWPSSFAQQVTPRVVCWQRRWFRYGWRWRMWMQRLNLTATGPGHVAIPTLRRVELVPAGDRLLVELPAGLDVEQVHAAAGKLATAVRAESCRVTADAPGLVWMEFRRRDVLARLVPALPVPAPNAEGMVPVELAAVPVGVRDNGTAWRIPLKGRHVLVAGRSRSGKGSVLWSVLRHLAPAIRCGLVRVSGIDPKGGMELALGRQLFTRYEADDLGAMADLLEAEADHMDHVARSLAGDVRKFRPSMANPLHLLIIDELATLTAYAPMEVRRRVESALGRLMTKGAAVGWVVLGCVQEPSKDIIPMRGLFTYRIALGLDTDSQVDMVLGEGMRAAGALADQIPLSTPGVGYAKSEFEAAPFRVRAAFVTDTEIRAMAAQYAPVDGQETPTEPARTEPAAVPARPVEAVKAAAGSWPGPVQLAEVDSRQPVPVVPDSLLAKLRAMPSPSESNEREAVA